MHVQQIRCLKSRLAKFQCMFRLLSSTPQFLTSIENVREAGCIPPEEQVRDQRLWQKINKASVFFVHVLMKYVVYRLMGLKPFWINTLTRGTVTPLE